MDDVCNMFPRTFLSDDDVTAINSNKWGRKTDHNKMVTEVIDLPIGKPQVRDTTEAFILTQGESRTVTIPQSGLLYINVKSSKPMHIHRPSAPTLHAWNQVLRVRGTSLLALNFQHEIQAKQIADAWEYRADEMTMIVSSQVVGGQLTFDITPWNFDELTIDSTFGFEIQTLGEDEEQTGGMMFSENFEYANFTSGWEWAFNPALGQVQAQARYPLKVCVENKPMIGGPESPATIQLPDDANRMFHVVLLPLEGDAKFARPIRVKTETKSSFIPMPAARCLFNVQDVFGGIAFNCAGKHKSLTLAFNQPTKFVVSVYSSPHEEFTLVGRHYNETGIVFTC